MSEPKKPPVIELTTDYERFNLEDSNRRVRPRKLQKMIERVSKKNLLHLYPIIVASDGNVRDGQHRLEVARILDVPIYFIESDDMEVIDVGYCAVVTDSWNTVDFVHFYAEEGSEDYQKLLDLVEKYPSLTISTALMLTRTDNSRMYDTVREGEYEFKEGSEEKVEEVMSLREDMRDHIHMVYNTRSFLYSLKALLSQPDFDRERFLDKLRSYGRPIFRRARASDYLDQYELIYNYRMKKDRVSFT